MGSGASFDAGLTAPAASERYFCHACHRVFGLGNIDSPADYCCPHCHSTFLEEIGARNSIQALRSSPYPDPYGLRHPNHGQLSLEQTRRISNATAMLRLLESQLRDELEHLQHAFETANIRANGAQNKPKKMTKAMSIQLKNRVINLDMICSQPSCPICSEDLILGNYITQLPCSHIFHKSCVLPWLDMKQNCPICRSELPDKVPSAEELEKFTNDELKERLAELEIELSDESVMNREELAALLHKHLTEIQAAEELEMQNAISSSSSVSSFTIGEPMLHINSNFHRQYFPFRTLGVIHNNNNDNNNEIVQSENTNILSDDEAVNRQSRLGQQSMAIRLGESSSEMNPFSLDSNEHRTHRRVQEMIINHDLSDAEETDEILNGYMSRNASRFSQASGPRSMPFNFNTLHSHPTRAVAANAAIRSDSPQLHMMSFSTDSADREIIGVRSYYSTPPHTSDSPNINNSSMIVAPRSTYRLISSTATDNIGQGYAYNATNHSTINNDINSNQTTETITADSTNTTER
eukprot:gene5899-8139_t